MLKKLILGLLVLLVGLGVTGAVYQWLAERADAERFAPPGRLYEVDGLTLHLDCRGRGRPVVLMEAGLTTGSWSWGPVFEAVAEHTEVCAYDRPGMGWSEPINRLADAAEVAARFNALIGTAGLEGPYVLLGMSAGGVYVREYYHRYPDDVAGMVLVDSSHEQQGHRLLPMEAQADVERMVGLCAWLQPLGVIRATDALSSLFGEVAVSDEARPLLMSRVNQSHYCASILAESRSFKGEVYDAEPPAPLGDLPLVVLSQGAETRGNEAFGLTAAQREVWDVLQMELAALSTRGRRLVAEDSGHMIQLEQPAIVIDAVVELVGRLRGQATRAPASSGAR